MYSSKKIIRNIDNEHILFFVQSFLELSSYKSSESHKAKMMMSISLCEEYKILFHHEHVKDDYLNIIIDELISSISKDIIATEMLHFNIEEYTKKGLTDKTNKNQQYAIIKLILEELHPLKYIKNSIEFLYTNLSKKNDIRSVLSNLISLLNFLEITNPYLFFACKTFFEENSCIDINTKELIEKFFNEIIFSLPTEYDVYIEVRKLPKLIDNDFFKKNIKNASIVDKKTQQELCDKKIFYTKKRSSVLLFEKISSKDPYMAIAEAHELINRIYTIYKIFNHSDKIFYGKSDLALDTTKDKKYYFSSEITAITHQKDVDYSIMREKFQNFFSNFFIHSDSMHKFDKALTLHSYALQNAKPETQLIFFWSALESIAVKNNPKSIINSTISFMLPFLKKRYYYENFQYIYDELLQFDKDKIEKIFNEANIEFNVINLAKSIILEKNEIKNILKLLDDYPLLRHKIYVINKELKTPKKVLEKNRLHETRLIEQIHRIYRFRNLIIHDSTDIDISEILLSNLHNYFDYILDEIIEHSYNRKVHNIDELRLYLEMKNEKNIKYLEVEETITDENFLDIFLLD